MKAGLGWGLLLWKRKPPFMMRLGQQSTVPRTLSTSNLRGWESAWSYSGDPLLIKHNVTCSIKSDKLGDRDPQPHFFPGYLITKFCNKIIALLKWFLAEEKEGLKGRRAMLTEQVLSFQAFSTLSLHGCCQIDEKEKRKRTLQKTAAGECELQSTGAWSTRQ